MSSDAGSSSDSRSNSGSSPPQSHSRADFDPLRAEPVTETVRAIHGSNCPGVLAITGGGSLAISDLLTVPGASGTLLEVHVPYSPHSLAHYLGFPPEQACSNRTARALAMVAFLRASQLHPTAHSPDEPTRIWGIGCTASLRSSQPKRGDHRFHLALQTPGQTLCWSLTLSKGTRSRLEEERLTADFLLALLARACRVDEFPLSETSLRDHLRDHERLEQRDSPPPPGCRELLLGEISALRSLPANNSPSGMPDPSESPSSEPPPRKSLLLFPGAFNPPHTGHRRMAEWAEQEQGRPVQFEISLENVDKPLLDYQELTDRLAPFRQDPGLTSRGRAVWLTRAPTFVEKSLLFPAATFLVGLDTAIRIADPRYYANQADRDAAIATLKEQGCRFLVFGRIVGKRFQTLDQAELPDSLRALCRGISEEEFRDDHSSSAIRRQQQNATAPNH